VDLSLSDLTRDLEALRDETLERVDAAGDSAALEALELEVLGKKGRLTATLRGFASLAADRGDADAAAELRLHGRELGAVVHREHLAGVLGNDARHDVAGAAVFLASPAAAFITGQMLLVGGGVVM